MSPERIEFKPDLQIRDHYPDEFCICELSLDERCHIHGTEPCLGCLVHPEGRAMEVVAEGQEPQTVMSHPWVVPNDNASRRRPSSATIHFDTHKEA